jgi:hypothetical protein
MTIHGMLGRGRTSILFVAMAALLLVGAGSGCSSDDAPKADAATGEGPDAANVIDSGTPEADADLGDWKVLNEGSWTIPVNSGNDPYYCIISTVHEDIYIKAFKGMIPVGTHHTVLTIYDGNEPDGIVPCNAGTNGPSMIYGTGIGTPPLYFPDGVGLHLRPGTRLINNLHLFNSGDTSISGTSGTYYLPAQPSEIQHEAEIVLAGPLSLSLPPGQKTTQSGACKVSSISATENIHVFSLAPHMHRLGTHMKTTLERTGAPNTVLMDTDYQFESQTFELQNPFIELRPTDVIRTECTYDNTTGSTVGFGQNSNNEMCFSDLYYFPAQSAQFICWDPGV